MNRHSAIFLAIALLAPSAFSRDIREEMKRAERFGRDASSHLLRNEIQPFWSADGSHLVYQVNDTRGGHHFFKVDLASGAKAPAFDHDALAKVLGAAVSKKLRADALPLEQVDCGTNSGSFRFRAFGKGWRCDVNTQQLVPDEVPPVESHLLAPEDAMRTEKDDSGPTSLTIENATPGEIELFWVEDAGRRKSYGRIAPGGTHTQQTFGGHVWVMADASGKLLAGVVARDTPSYARVTGKIRPAPRKHHDLSPDGKWRAVIRNCNLLIEPVAGGEAVRLSSDGSEQDHYTGPFEWSPDSSKLVSFRVKEVETRRIHIVQSSPPGQLQPKLLTIDYPKPGDPIPQPKPRLFDVAGRREIPVPDALFDNPWEINHGAWSGDPSEYSFVYNQRGHQVMRMVAIRGDSGSARTVFEEHCDTFIDYSQKFFLKRLPETHELLWTSERDGFNHLYRLDDRTGEVMSRLTTGDMIVRDVVEVDAKKRQVLLKLMGMPGSDPYHAHYARVNFDGSGFTRLTESDGNHAIEFSPDGKWIIDRWSRVDQPQVVEIRRADDGKLLTEIERADDSELMKTGWSRPERFVAKGRDGKTDICGIIIRPTRFDPTKKYPVLEYIYAGPHDFFVPKNYETWSGMNSMAELGFVVVQIDGMGTNWRSRAFHDVCWKNLADSGFPDRIPWIKAAASTRPWMDLARVGIYGGSAGGQSALAGLLHHGDFYKAGVADCGCHDNRMDKIWWNEAWMGWPVDDSYSRNSNVTNAGKLTGRLLLVVGEIDHNVDPASTAQVVAALEKAGRDFEYLPIMNSDHGAAETPYGKYRRAEFLVRSLEE